MPAGGNYSEEGWKMNRNFGHSLFVSFAILLTVGLAPCLCLQERAWAGTSVAPDGENAIQDVTLADEEDIPVAINEVMAANSSFVMDPQGQYDDWIELRNLSNAPLDIGGMYLTDDVNVPTKWRIPTNIKAVTTLPAGGFQVIWADAHTTDPGLHASFRLDADGDAIYLFASDGNTPVDSVEFGGQLPNISYGRYPDGTGEWQFLTAPTPGKANFQTYEGAVGELKFSHEHGFYDEPFDVTITCTTPEASIYYSTDGSEPYKEGGRFPTGRQYTKPIRITQTTCLRARAIKPGWIPGKMVAQTYIFLDQVTRQSNSPVGFPNSWGGTPADYQMDPRIVTGHVEEIKDGLQSIPTMSLVMKLDDVFGATQGMYANPSGRDIMWERPASLELIWPDGREGFQANCGIRIYGDVGRQAPYKKKTFRLLFKGMYGQTSLRYPLYGEDAVDEFDQLILRANFNDGYPFGQDKSQYIRDEYCRRLQLALGQPSSHGRFVHLYINGLYWGLYNPVERPDASFTSRYCGGNKEDWDVYKSALPVGGSTMDSWNGLLNAVNQGVRTNEGYQRLQGNNPDGTPNPVYVDYLDLENYVDYMIVNFFVGNTDWPHKNWYGGMNRVRSTGFKCFCWDTEWVMDLVLAWGSLDSYLSQNVVGASSGIAQPYARLRDNPDFRLRFADHMHRAFFNGGPLYVDPARPSWNPAHPEQNRPAAAYAALASSIEKAMFVETARWGDVGSSTPHNITEWRAERDYLVNTYMVQRPGIVMGQLRSAGLYPNVEAPVFQINGAYQHGGHAAVGARLSLTGGATMWYTLDGSDPRVPAQGSAPTNTSSSTLVAENAAKRVLVPAGPVDNAWRGGKDFDDSAWTAVTGSPGGIGFERSTGYEKLISIDLGQQMYGKQATCYVRIPFTLDRDPAQLDAVQLRVRYDDGFIAYLNGTEVARKNFTGEPVWDSGANAANPDMSAITFEDIALPNARDCLKKGSNILAVQALNQGTTSSDFLFSAMLVTGQGTSGGSEGTSATAVRYSGPVTLTGSARVKARTLSGGTWSALNEAVFAVGPVAQSLRVSEIMYHPLDSGNPDDPNTEYIELTNIAGQAINLNLVHFTNGIDYTFPSFELPPAGYCLIVKDLAAFEARYGSKLPVVGEYQGNLNNAGERLELVDAAGQVIQSFEYQDNWYDITDGRGFSLTVKDPPATDANSLSSKSFWRPSAQAGGSPGTNDGGQVPELGSVVINELLANSQGVGPDWIELYNSTDQSINMGGWFLSDDANNLTKYQIAPGTSIPAHGYLVFYENKHFGNQADLGCQEPFGLSKDGETLYLHSGSGGVLSGYSEQEKFDASEAGVSLGRWQKSTGSYNFVALSAPTPGKANAAPVVGPVVINEIMYHPQEAQDDEYVELLNISSSPVTLYDGAQKAPWRFTDGGAIELLLPADAPVTLAPGEYLVLAKDAGLLRSKYSVPETVQVLAWGPGNLADSGAKIQLSKPGDTEDDGTRHWIRVDRVVYSDGSHPQDFLEGVDPWPVKANGQGLSLSRIDPHAYGNDPENWKAATPSPGQANP
jgi:hypothetical protein